MSPGASAQSSNAFSDLGTTSLALLAQEGNAAALEVLLHRIRGEVRDAAQRAPDPAEVEQDALVAIALRFLPGQKKSRRQETTRYQEVGLFRRWATKITSNLARWAWQRKGRGYGSCGPEGRVHSEDLDVHAGNGLTPSAQLHYAELEAAAYACVEDIDETYREAVRRRVFRSDSEEDVAKDLGITVNALRTRVTRGTQQLERMIEERGSAKVRRVPVATFARELGLPEKVAEDLAELASDLGIGDLRVLQVGKVNGKPPR